MGIFVGFDALNKEQAGDLLEYAEAHGLTAAGSKPAAGKKKAAGKKTAGKKGKGKGKSKETETETEGAELPSTRMITSAAAKYAEKFGKDARKTVLNTFGATTVGGANGLATENYQQVLDIFKSMEEYQPEGNAGDKDKNWKEASGKKKKKGKGKKKKKGSK